MFTCPWCGTTYLTFQPNCNNCGGPLPASRSTDEHDPDDSLPVPPPIPRPVPNHYAWKLMVTDGWAIAAFVFAILGVTFFPLGAAMTPWTATVFVGIPFLILGILFLGAAFGVGRWRYLEARAVVRVLQVGRATEGRITQTEVNPNVAINGRNPWAIRYTFQAGGRTMEGEASTLNLPGSSLQPGRRAWILYLTETPERNTLYPHP